MKRAVISLFMIMFFSLNAEQFQMSGKLIKSKISYQNLNRISVKGDKIDTLVGIDTAFHFEKNEKTGEVFIRPTEDNGYNPISISVTTTSGKTQDLLLEVTDGEANSIELIAENSASADFANEYLSESEDPVGSNDYEENIAAVMKKFINLSPNHEKLEIEIEDRPHTYVVAKFQEAYRIDGFLCLKFQITTKSDFEGKYSRFAFKSSKAESRRLERRGSIANASQSELDISYILDERMFSRKGDIALSLSSLRLGKNSSATLYVLRR